MQHLLLNCLAGNACRYGTFTLALLMLLALPARAAEEVVYSWAESRAQDERGHYPVALLTLALQKAGGTYDPHPAKHDLTQDRTLRHVELQRELDITWTLTTPEREARLLPIRIPIDRGLLGWRLLLINKSDVDFFAGINSAQQIKQLLAGQEQDWPDYKILLHNGFKVTPTTITKGCSSCSSAGAFAIFHVPRLRSCRNFMRIRIRDDVEKRNKLLQELTRHREQLELLVDERTKDLRQQTHLLEQQADATQEGKVKCWVKDFGAGLTDEQQAELFDLFVRFDKKSTDGHGLGLSIVKRIAHALDGEVGYERSDDGGSVFWFSLPTAK